MPDYLGNLTAEEERRAFSYLQQAWRNWRCPVDPSHRQYVLQPTIVQLAPLQGNEPVRSIQGEAPSYVPLTYPMLVVSCATCGYMSLVSAIVAGALTAEDG